jgi:hypothetical protein
MFGMVKCGVLFEVRADFLNIIYTNFNFKGLNNFKKYYHIKILKLRKQLNRLEHRKRQQDHVKNKGKNGWPKMACSYKSTR